MIASAIVVAAGRGTRMGPGLDKLFLEVAGLPVVGHTWRRFDRHPAVSEVILAVRPGLEPAFEALAARIQPHKPWRLVLGGAERQDSVWAGLTALNSSSGLVAIHDGARPCTSARAIASTLETAAQCGAAVTACRVTDTIKQSTDGRWIDRNVDRSLLWAVQTPQAFRVEVIRQALDAVRASAVVVTDDTAACERLGIAVQLVPCADPNPKVTVPEDLPYIEFCLQQLANHAPCD